jgi:beta-lactamase regulating signal transducer with metallopeptidase domain
MKASILVLVALCATALLRHRSAALRHWILTVAIVSAAALPVFESIVPSIALLFRPSSFTELTVESRLEAAPQGSSGALAERTARSVVNPLDRRAGDAGRGTSIASFVEPVWIAGMVVSLLGLGIGLSRLAWFRRRSQPITSGNWARLSEEICREYGVGRPVRLLQSDHPSLLATWGVRSPSIIIPAAAVHWPDDLVRIVLRHELAHIRRGDWIVQMAAEIVRSVYWFSPVLWLACRRLRLESEHACDDAVLRSGVEGSAYASHLLCLARALNHQHAFFPATAMARSSSLHKRVSAMLNDTQNRSPISRLARVATVIALVLSAGAIAAAQVFATFSGSLVDPQGAALPGVQLHLSNAERRINYDAKTNRGGDFEFVGLPPGDYVFEAQMPGFKPYRAAVTMTGSNLRRAIALEIGSLQETVTIVDGDDSPTAPVELRTPRANPPCPSAAASRDVRLGGNIRSPNKIRHVMPQYPASLRGTGTEGTVVIDARIGLDGFVKDVRVHEPANTEFAKALVTAVNHWQWDSTLLNCVPTEVAITVTGRFQPRR